jgi:hypothetical protein
MPNGVSNGSPLAWCNLEGEPSGDAPLDDGLDIGRPLTVVRGPTYDGAARNGVTTGTEGCNGGTAAPEITAISPMAARYEAVTGLAESLSIGRSTPLAPRCIMPLLLS